VDIPSLLLAIIIILGASSFCLYVFERIGLGAILGLIVAGILIGPHTPGPAPVHSIEQLQQIAELGVVLFLFTVGLEMQPQKLWSLRTFIFGLGSAQMLLTTAALTAYLTLILGAHWQSAIILSLGFAMSSTAIVMATLGERKELNQPHGTSSFAILMAQDLWIIPVMAMVPILAHQSSGVATPLWQTIATILLVIGAIILIGRSLLPALLGSCARRGQMDLFSALLLLAVTAAVWAVSQAGISMTLGAFLLGMLLSGSPFRYQVEATIAPFKKALMALFFLAVGMSIDIGVLTSEWSSLIVHVPMIVAIKIAVLILLALAFGIGRSAAIRTGFYLSQVGEFAFVLVGAATVVQLLTPRSATLATLVIAITMVLTPLLVIAGNRLASVFNNDHGQLNDSIDEGLSNHVVISGYSEYGRLIALMLERVGIPSVTVDANIDIVRSAQQAGHQVHFGDIMSDAIQQAVNLSQSRAIYIGADDRHRCQAEAITLNALHPDIPMYVKVKSIQDSRALAKEGVKHALTDYIETTLNHGRIMLNDLGLSSVDIEQLIGSLRQDAYAMIHQSP